MHEPTSVIIEIRGNKYEGSLTDADGLLFMGALLEPHEIVLLEKGRTGEAGRLLQARFDHRRKELEQQGYSDQELVAELSATMMWKVERDPEERSRIAARIKERFPSIPDSIVKWEPRSAPVIHLDLEELMQLIVGVIGPALQRLETLKPKQEQMTGATQETQPEITDTTKTNMTAAAAKIVELEAQIEKIKRDAITSSSTQGEQFSQSFKQQGN